jgi:zinc protease
MRVEPRALPPVPADPHIRRVLSQIEVVTVTRNLRPAVRTILCAVLAASAACRPAQTPPVSGSRAPAPGSSISVPFEKYALPNGLTVVLAPDRATPTVAVVAMYHVGSKNEQPGLTGFAHLFEHVMFTGSGHIPYGVHDRMTEGIGGSNNGSTNNDITQYYESVPANYLEHALWLESDRMGWLLDALDTAKYSAQRAIVKNERRQSYDNQPYGRVDELIAAAMYPPTHPYSWPVIGSMKDLDAAPVEAVKEFFRLYYAPNNATLSIAGDFDVAKTKSLIAKYFGEIPRGRAFTRPVVPPTVMTTEKRLVFEDRVQVPRLYLTWPVVGMQSDDRLALDVLASILTGPRTARLTKELVYDRQWASAIGAGNYTAENTGQFEISITPRPGFTLAQLELATDSILARIKRDGVTADEVKRALAPNELAFVRNLESNLGKAFSLATSQTFFNDPAYDFTTTYARLQAVTADDVKRVATQYLTPGRVVLSAVPVGRKAEASKAEQSTQVGNEAAAPAPPAPAARPTTPAAPAPPPLKSSFDRTVTPKPGADPALNVPAWTKSTLSNGATLVVSERRGLPLVSFTLTLTGGAAQYDPPTKTGLGGFVSGMLSEGTTTKSGDELSTALQMLGTSIAPAVGSESGSMSFVSMKSNFAPTLDLLTDMMLHPAFPNDALERLRARTLVSLTQARDRTASIAGVVFPRVVYSLDHPYGRSTNETTVKAITRDDLLTFHKAFVQPARATITVVGDITPAAAKQTVERALAGWPASGAKADFSYPPVPAAAPTTIYLVDKPGAAQSTVSIGFAGPPRTTPDYYALRVMNSLFGELFLSRLNLNIREQKGYSYGVSSRFAYGRGPGPFRAGGEIQTGVTDSALVEFMKEIRGIRGARPVADDEMEAAKAALIQSLPGRFESVSGVGATISDIFVQGLPEDYLQQFTREVRAVTKADVQRVAQKYLDPDRLAIVIVGDRAKIEAPLRATRIAPIVILDMDGNPKT